VAERRASVLVHLQLVTLKRPIQRPVELEHRDRALKRDCPLRLLNAKGLCKPLQDLRSREAAVIHAKTSTRHLSMSKPALNEEVIIEGDDCLEISVGQHLTPELIVRDGPHRSGDSSGVPGIAGDRPVLSNRCRKHGADQLDCPLPRGPAYLA